MNKLMIIKSCSECPGFDLYFSSAPGCINDPYDCPLPDLPDLNQWVAQYAVATLEADVVDHADTIAILRAVERAVKGGE